MPWPEFKGKGSLGGWGGRESVNKGSGTVEEGMSVEEGVSVEEGMSANGYRQRAGCSDSGFYGNTGLSRYPQPVETGMVCTELLLLPEKVGSWSPQGHGTSAELGKTGQKAG